MKLYLFVFLSVIASQSLQAADVITFADANVKALCVDNWDTSGDKELSKEEAAAVTSLGTVFRERTDIGEFPELIYFKGLTSIDEYAFYKSTISGELRVPGNVKSIGDFAFNSCNRLTSVILEEGVDSVGWNTFSGPIRTLSLPASLKFMSPMAIDPYVNISSSGVFVPEGDLYVYSLSKTPPSINDYAFFYVFSAAHLIVPFGCIDAYKSSWAWSQFREYLEAGDVNGDGALNVKDVTSMNAYIMKNSPSPFDKRLADLNGDGEINVKDVTLMCTWIMQQGLQQEQ